MPDDILNFINGLKLAGIPLVVLLPFLIEGFKRLGMPTHWTGIISLVLAVLSCVGIYVVKHWPETDELITLFVLAILLGLAVPGLYSQFKLFASGNPSTPSDPNKPDNLFLWEKERRDRNAK